MQSVHEYVLLLFLSHFRNEKNCFHKIYIYICRNLFTFINKVSEEYSCNCTCLSTVLVKLYMVVFRSSKMMNNPDLMHIFMFHAVEGRNDEV